MSGYNWSPASSKSNSLTRPPWEPLYKYVFLLLLAFITADLGVLSLRPQMIPQDLPPKKPAPLQRIKSHRLSDYAVIQQRNIFNSDGVIPKSLSEQDQNNTPNQEAPAVPSNLPLKLMGTIVHFNPNLSVASIELSSQNKTNAYQIGEEVSNLAHIIQIERQKVIFRNLKTQIKEYIEIPKDLKMNFGVATPPPPGGSIQSEDPYNFKVSRKELFKQIENLNEFVKQARADPYYGPNGMEGFQIKWIQPGSLIEKLGVKVGDMIKGVNGEDIKDPRAAMEALHALKNSSHVKLNFSRNGRDEEINYNINE